MLATQRTSFQSRGLAMIGDLGQRATITIEGHEYDALTGGLEDDMISDGHGSLLPARIKPFSVARAALAADSVAIVPRKTVVTTAAGETYLVQKVSDRPESLYVRLSCTSL